VTLSANNVGMSVSTDDPASEAVVRKDHGCSIVDVVTQEDNAVVVKGSRVGGIPREDGTGMAYVDVGRVPLDGEAHCHRRTLSKVREVDANLVRVLSRPSGECVLEGGPVGCMLNTVTGLGKEVGDQ
jgi:hypothetical protein